MNTKESPSQITGYSFKPFIELTPEETKKLSAMTRNAKNVIYVTGFLANTKMNKNHFRITDNKYIEQNKGLAAGRPINFGPKMLGKAHHPNFYRDLDLDGKTDAEARQMFLDYQEWSRIGDILKIDYDIQRDQWKFYGAISHPNVVEAIQSNTLQLPKYVSPYFWNLNDPSDTGPEIREAELFHVSFVDEPAYSVEAIAGTCQASEGADVCAARVFGLPAGKIQKVQSSKGIPPCACGLMAAYENKIDSSFYIETPKNNRTNLSEQDPNNNNPPQKDDNNGNDNQQDNNNNNPQTSALNKMKEWDKKANENTGDLTNTNTNKDKNAADSEKNPKIPIEFQDLVNVQIEKERKQIARQHEKVLAEKDGIIAELQKEISKRNESDRDAILNKYIEEDNYKDKTKYKERLEFYKNLAKESNLSNEKLETLLQDHYEVKELKISIDHKGGQSRGKGAGILNMDPFGFENNDSNVGLLQSSRAFKGIGASVVDPNNNNEDPTDADEDNPADDSNSSNKNASAIVSAFG